MSRTYRYCERVYGRIECRIRGVWAILEKDDILSDKTNNRVRTRLHADDDLHREND